MIRSNANPSGSAAVPSGNIDASTDVVGLTAPRRRGKSRGSQSLSSDLPVRTSSLQQGTRAQRLTIAVPAADGNFEGFELHQLEFTEPAMHPVTVTVPEGVLVTGPPQGSARPLPNEIRIKYPGSDRTDRPLGYVYVKGRPASGRVNPNGIAKSRDERGEFDIVCAFLGLHENVRRQHHQNAKRQHVVTGATGKLTSRSEERKAEIGSPAATTANVPSVRRSQFMDLQRLSKKNYLVGIEEHAPFLWAQCTKLTEGESVQLMMQSPEHTMSVHIARRKGAYVVKFFDPNSLEHWSTTLKERSHVEPFASMLAAAMKNDYAASNDVSFHMFYEMPKGFVDRDGKLDRSTLAKTSDDPARSLEVFAPSSAVSPGAVHMLLELGLPLDPLKKSLALCETSEQRAALLKFRAKGQNSLTAVMRNGHSKRVAEFCALVKELLIAKKLAPEHLMEVLATGHATHGSGLKYAGAGPTKAYLCNTIDLLARGFLSPQQAIELADPVEPDTKTLLSADRAYWTAPLVTALFDAIAQVPLAQFKKQKSAFMQFLASPGEKGTKRLPLHLGVAETGLEMLESQGYLDYGEATGLRKGRTARIVQQVCNALQHNELSADDAMVRLTDRTDDGRTFLNIAQITGLDQDLENAYAAIGSLLESGSALHDKRPEICQLLAARDTSGVPALFLTCANGQASTTTVTLEGLGRLLHADLLRPSEFIALLDARHPQSGKSALSEAFEKGDAKAVAAFFGLTSSVLEEKRFGDLKVALLDLLSQRDKGQTGFSVALTAAHAGSDAHQKVVDTVRQLVGKAQQRGLLSDEERVRILGE